MVLMLLFLNVFNYEFYSWIDADWLSFDYHDIAWESIIEIAEDLYNNELLYLILFACCLLGIASTILFIIDKRLDLALIFQTLSACLTVIALLSIATGFFYLTDDREAISLRLEGVIFIVYCISVIIIGQLVLKKYKQKIVEKNNLQRNTTSINDNYAEKLLKLRDLLDENIITQAEFDIKKKQILNLTETSEEIND